MRLTTAAPDLERALVGGAPVSPLHPAAAISRESVWVATRDGVRLATDLYLPPGRPAPAIAVRTPYSRAKLAETFVALARQGYVVASQDCRGTGDSEPDHWDYYVYEREDSVDFVEWVVGQEWFDGFLGSLGGSYVAGTQWCMAMHPSMSAIAPEVGGLGLAPTTRPRFHMFVNAYSRSVGRGAAKVATHYEELEGQMVEQTLAGGYFNEPLYAPFSATLVERYPELRSLSPGDGRRRLWERYSALPPAERADLLQLALGEDSVTSAGIEALPAVFGHRLAHDAHLLPRVHDAALVESLQAPALLVTGWYDWCLDDALATWEALVRDAREPVRSRSRLVITPGAHNMPGYREGAAEHPELERVYRTEQILELLLSWYAAVREDALEAWPAVVYYLMGANEWRAASAWPPREARTHVLHLGPAGALTTDAPREASDPDSYTYDPEDPTPTVGGSIVSFVYPPGSVDVNRVQERPDVLTYTTPPLERAVDVVGPIRLVLYAGSNAVDTDFSARLSDDVFPDGRALQLQSVTLRARYRNPNGEPELLEPGRIYRLEIDMWATANRFARGHRLRLDLSSADFPKFDRNTNRGGDPGTPLLAEQTIYHNPEQPSHLVLSVVSEHEEHVPPTPTREETLWTS